MKSPERQNTQINPNRTRLKLALNLIQNLLQQQNSVRPGQLSEGPNTAFLSGSGPAAAPGVLTVDFLVQGAQTTILHPRAASWRCCPDL